MEHAETKHLERAPARGPVGPAHGRSRPTAPLHAVPTTTSSRSGCGAGDTTGWVSHCSFVPSDIRGAIWQWGEAIPLNVLGFIAAQLGIGVEDLGGYAIREETRREHLAELRRIYGYRMFSGRCTRDLKTRLEREAEGAPSNEGLARRFVEECRRRQVILPGSVMHSAYRRAIRSSASPPQASAIHRQTIIVSGFHNRCTTGSPGCPASVTRQERPAPSTGRSGAPCPNIWASTTAAKPASTK